MKRFSLHTLGLAALLGIGLLAAPNADARGGFHRGGIRGSGWHGGGGWSGGVVLPWVGDYDPYYDDGDPYYTPGGVYFWDSGRGVYRRGGHGVRWRR